MSALRPTAANIPTVTNAINHGLAGIVEVRLLESEGRLRVTIRDDGTGFEPDALHATPEGRGLGLLGNAERMAEIGGIEQGLDELGEHRVETRFVLDPVLAFRAVPVLELIGVAQIYAGESVL